MKTNFKLRATLRFILLVLLSFTFTSYATYAQNIGGIGAQLFLDTAGGFTMPRILSLVPNTPADQNLKATDYIIKVNNVSCKDKTIEDVVAMIRGEEGTIVKITVADTKQGKRPREYDLPRVAIQVGPPPDPLTAFNNSCENEVKQMKKKGLVVIKTFPSDCGNYFFNFNADATTYHIRVMTMEEKAKTGGTHALSFYPTARVFDGDNEAGAITLNKIDPKDIGASIVAQVEGEISFKKSCVGVVSVQIHDDVTKCRSMYVIVYK